MDDTLQELTNDKKHVVWIFFIQLFTFCFTKQMFADVLWRNNSTLSLKKNQNKTKRKNQGLLPHLIKKRDSCPFTTSPDSQSDSDSCSDIRLSALVDNITFSFNVQ